MIMQFAVTIIVVFLVQVMNMKSIAIYIASILYGVAFSAMFGLFFVLPSQYGVEVTCQEGSSFLMYGQLGEGMISMVVGYLMSWFTPTMLYYSIFVCGLLLYWSCNKIINTLVQQKQQQAMAEEMKQLPSVTVMKPKHLMESIMKEQIDPSKSRI